MVFLDLLLDGSGRAVPERATVKSPAAISRFLGRTAVLERMCISTPLLPMRTLAQFLNHVSWDTRRLSRMLPAQALETTPAPTG